MPQQSAVPLILPGHAEEFPFLLRLVETAAYNWRPVVDEGSERLDAVFPYVRLAGADLMWRRPSSLSPNGIYDGELIDQSDCTFRQTERLLCVEDGERFYGCREHVFIRDIFDRVPFGITHLVIATMRVATKKHGGNFPHGHRHDRTLKLEIFREPKGGGFADLFRNARLHDVPLSTEQIIDGCHLTGTYGAEFKALKAGFDALQAEVSDLRFLRLVLRRAVERRDAALHADFHGVQVLVRWDLSMTISFRSSITFHWGKDPADLTPSWSGIDGSLQRVQSAVDCFVNAWHNTPGNPDKRFQLVDHDFQLP